jgi:hypothetical protein
MHQMGWFARSMTWIAACGGYLLFEGVVDSPHEWITAGLIATAATVWAWAIHRCGHLRFAFPPAHAVEWAKAAISLGPAVVKTFRCSWRVRCWAVPAGAFLKSRSGAVRKMVLPTRHAALRRY